MTRMRAGSGSPPDPARTAASDRGLFHPSKLPAGAPEVLSKNTIAVTDPARVYPWNKDRRQRDFNLLVKRYKNQLLYGCQNPYCTTPTCFSYRKRVADAPLRRFTELSARTVACYLASQDNPERGLCRNAPATTNDFPSTDGIRRPGKRPVESSHQNVKFSSDIRNYYPEENVPTEDTRGQDVQQGGNDGGGSESIRVEGRPDLHGEEERDVPRLKDPKSFTQNLFDTLSLRMVEWLPLRRSPEVFDNISARANEAASTAKSPGMEIPAKSQPDGQPSNPKRPSREKNGVSHSNVKSRPSSFASAAAAHSQPTAVEVKIPGQPVKRLSLGEMEHRRQPSRTHTEEKVRSERKPVRKLSHTPSNTSTRRRHSPPPLKHRPQKHRHGNGDTSDSYYDKRPPPHVSWEGPKCPNQRGKTESYNVQSPTDHTLHRAPTRAQYHAISTEESDKSASSQQIQSLSHLSKEIVDGLETLMCENDEDKQTWSDELTELQSRGYPDSWDWQYATHRQRQAFPFVAQSIFYVLSSPDQLLQSFRGSQPPSNGNESDSTVFLDTEQLEGSFRTLYQLCPWETTLHSLWVSLERLFVPPKELSLPGPQAKRVRTSASGHIPKRGLPSPCIGDSSQEHISDVDAAYISVITLLALASSIPQIDPKTWQAVRQARSAGTVLPDSEMRKHSKSTRRLLVDVADKFEHDLALRLVNRLARVVSARVAYHEISKTRLGSIQDLDQKETPNFIDLVLRTFRDCPKRYRRTSQTTPASFFDDRPVNSNMIAVEWLRSFLLKEWDGKPEMAKSSAAGGALQLLASMYKERLRLGLQPEDFHTSFLSERLDPTEMPVEWLGMVTSNRTVHLLSYPFLFPPSALVIYFRALNYSTMSKSYENALTTSRHLHSTTTRHLGVHDDVSVNLQMRLKTSTSIYLVLVVRRNNVLTDALDQLWRREKRELMRPLKVQMGMDEGEEGIDHGGVQQEFFRVAIGEALDPSYGMFTMDMRSRISWFQPCSMEPLYKFELLGLLTSLAVYNGLTLPVNFPVALYKKLLGFKIKSLDDIRVGWSELAKGLGELLSWEDGDVGDIFMRTYEFSFEAFGNFMTVDMEKVDRNEPWPAPERSAWDRRRRGSYRSSLSSKSSQARGSEDSVSMLRDTANETGLSKRDGVLSGILKGTSSRTYKPAPPSPPAEAALVTNANRERFVRDYIFWLTDKSIRPQYEAFARGFYTCLDRTALSIFTPEALKTVVEGIQEIDIGELEHHARYEGGFEPGHPLIVDFWNIVRRYPQTRKRQLLEFVTASDRVPVNGISSIMFVIQKNGTGDSRLPTSLTCFGRLLLPEYSSRAVLEEKLEKALENARGFGVA
ncbi:hypothetical protein FQN55_002925 [Onygenales sp. PD_40]|nr:hypothetical protein FQN55_002925 [Onygenales sp. PD_40]KAK2778864.1 hypothetical protein FQN53_001600 [Emmonsiellopsis sp. PD_33]